MGVDEGDVEEGDLIHYSKNITSFFAEKEVDLILAGNVVMDEASGQVGSRLAILLDLQCITTIVDMAILWVYKDLFNTLGKRLRIE